jgi:hypothetical protein
MSRSMKHAFQVVLLLVLTRAAVAAQKGSSLPPWRAPTNAELGSLEDQKWRQDDRARYLVVTGDFDGDGKPDQARLMVRADGKAFALFVKLGARDTAQKLDEFPDIWMLPSIGLKRVAPATYPTACARGIDCAEDEPKYIRVTHEAIDFFKTESAETYYYWNETRHAFARAGMSD